MGAYNISWTRLRSRRIEMHARKYREESSWSSDLGIIGGRRDGGDRGVAGVNLLVMV